MIELWNLHGTKILGVVGLIQTIVAGALSIPDLIPAASLKWWLLANLVLSSLVLKRGFDNSAAIAARREGEP